MTSQAKGFTKARAGYAVCLIAVVVLLGPIRSAAAAASDPNHMLKGSYGYFMWDVYGSSFPWHVDTVTVAELGVLTADGHGNLQVTECRPGVTVPLLRHVQ